MPFAPRIGLVTRRDVVVISSSALLNERAFPRKQLYRSRWKTKEDLYSDDGVSMSFAASFHRTECTRDLIRVVARELRPPGRPKRASDGGAIAQVTEFSRPSLSKILIEMSLLDEAFKLAIDGKEPEKFVSTSTKNLLTKSSDFVAFHFRVRPSMVQLEATIANPLLDERLTSVLRASSPT